MDDTPVSELMSSPVLTVSGETAVVEAARTFREKHVGSLVVGEEIVDGIVTEADIVAAVGDELDLGSTTVAEIMSEPVVTIRPG
ncbi:MAG: CBS domain-containing protein, partial [Haloarculaceae archaeon]